MNRAPIFSPLDFMRRNAGLIAGVALFVMLWMLVYTFVVYKPSYAAKSTVIIKDSAITTRLVEPEQYYATQTTSSSSSNPVLNTMGILKSGAISQALYTYFAQKRPEQLKKNHIKTPADWEKFFQDGSSFIKAKNQPGTDLIAIQFSWSDPVIAKEALEVVVKAFQEASRDLNKADQLSRTKFLEGQVKEIETRLADIRRQKSEYQSEKKTVSPTQEGGGLAASRLELSNKLNQLESQARGKENVARRYQQMLGMSYDKALKASALGQNGTLSKLQDELYRLEQSYSQLNTSLTETNPKVQEVKAQIEQVRTNIEAERARTMGRNSGGDAAGSVVADSTRGKMISDMLTAQAEAQDLRSQAAVVRGRLDEINAQISAFPSIAEGLANIDQKEASLSTALDHLRRKVLEGHLKEEQTLSNVFVVDAPRLPDKAQFPNRVHLIVLSVVLGLGAGLAIALAKEQFLTSREDTAFPAWMAPLDETQAAAMPAPQQALPVATRETVQPALPAPQAEVIQPTTRPIANPARVQPPAARQPQVAARPTPQVETGFRQDLTRPLQIEHPLRRQAPPSPKQPAQHLTSLQPELASRALEAALPAPQREATISDAQLMPPTKVPVSPLPAAETRKPRVRAAQPPAITPAILAGSAPASQNPPQPTENRRLRGLPAFLLEGSQQPAQTSEISAAAPIRAVEPKVIPVKQLLGDGDDLMADVVPMSAPADDARLAVQRPASVEAEFLANPEREPLRVSSFWFRKPQRPESGFGLSPRGRDRTNDTPGSLNRTMQALAPRRR